MESSHHAFPNLNLFQGKNSLEQQNQISESQQQSSSSSENEGIIDPQDNEDNLFPRMRNNKQVSQQRKQQKNKKNICYEFTPYTEYFLGVQSPSMYQKDCSQLKFNKFQYLVRPKPKYNPRQSLKQAISLSTTKQLQYVRGRVKNHMDQNFITNLLLQQKMSKKPINYVGQTSLMLPNNTLLFSHKNYIKKYILSQNNKAEEFAQQQLQFSSQQTNNSPAILVQLGQNILEIKKIDKIYLIIRTCKKLYLYFYDNDHHQIISYFSVDSFKGNHLSYYQITCVQALSKLDIIEIKIGVYFLNKDMCSIYDWHISKKKINKQFHPIPVNNQIKTKINQLQSIGKKKMLINFPQTFHHMISISSLNECQLLLGFTNKIIIFDVRTQNIVDQLYTSCNSSEKIFGLTMLNNEEYCSSSFVYSDSRSLQIYDLRYCETTKKYLHRLQQSPPSVLSFAGRFDNPVVLAYSPTKEGGGLLLDILSPSNQQMNKYWSDIPAHTFRDQYFNCPPLCNKFNNSLDAIQIINNPLRLFSSSLLNSNISLSSMSILKIEDKLGIIQIDECEGISIQYLQRGKFSGKIERLICQNSMNGSLFTQFDWVKQKILSVYLNQESKEEKEDDPQYKQVRKYINTGNRIQSDKLNYMTLTNFRKKIHQQPKDLEKVQNNTYTQTYCQTFQQPLRKHPQRKIENLYEGRTSRQSFSQKCIDDQLIQKLKKEWEIL